MKVDIMHIAKLSRLKIDDKNLSKFENEMEDIIRMVENLPLLEDNLNQVNINNAMELRDDKIQPSLHRDELLKNAPNSQAGCIVVPKTVE